MGSIPTDSRDRAIFMSFGVKLLQENSVVNLHQSDYK